MLKIALLGVMLSYVQSIYFYLERGQEKCFKDEVVKNYTLEMTINVLDKEIVEYYNTNLKKGQDGINLSVVDKKGAKLYSGVVWPNEQYEYDAEGSGEYRVCVSMTDSMFIKGFSQIKTQVKFASDFHREKNAKRGEVYKKPEAEEDTSMYKQGHFAPIRKRINKIYKKIIEIKQFQNYEREQEEMYEANQAKLASSFFWLSILQMAMVAASCVFSVWNLKKFFVKKAIFWLI